MSVFAKILLCLVATIVVGCSNRRTISQRPIGSEDVTQASGREIVAPTPSQEVYTKQKALSIKSVKKSNTTGSLTSLDDPRSYLLSATAPIVVGMFLDIKTVTNTDANKGAGAKDPAAAKPGQNAQQVEEELLKSLPNLDPVKDDPLKASVIPGFKVEVLEVLPNGDAIVGYHRRSVRGDQASDFLIKARVPQASLQDKDALTTASLADVEFRESQDGELSERYSSRWEDEYTLRMSGFDEARSKSAVALEEQRRQLKETRDKLATQIKTFSTERNTVAKERAEYLAKKKEDEQKMTDLDAKIKEQNEEIDKFKEKDAEREKQAEEAKLAEDEKDKDGGKGKKAPDKKAATAAKTDKPPVAASPKPIAQAAKPATANGTAKK